MDPEGVTKSAHDAGTAAHGAASAGHKVKKAWEWGEHIHFAHFVWTTILVPAPAIILSIAHWTERAAHSFWSLLVLTAPLTIAVTLIIRKFRLKDRLASEYWAYLGFPAIVLLASAFLSGWSGVGKAFDWHKALPQGLERGQITAWMMVPLAALAAFYDVYGAGAFFMSLSFGIVLGLVTSGGAAS